MMLPEICACPTCDQPKRKKSLYCSEACKKRAKRIESGNATVRTLICPETGQSFVTTDSRKKYVNREAAFSASDERKNKAASRFHNEKQTKAYTLYRSGEKDELRRLIERDINEPDAKTRQMFNLRYLQKPMRKTHGEVNSLNYGVYNNAKRYEFHAEIADTIGTDIEQLFFEGDPRNRTYVEICDAYCRAQYSMSLQTYIDPNSRNMASMLNDLDSDKPTVIDLIGIDHTIMKRSDGKNFQPTQEYSETEQCPRKLKMLIKHRCVEAKEKVYGKKAS